MKRIIVCCDGTWNKPETFINGIKIKTNVQRIYEGIEAGEGVDNNATCKQVKFYGSGVGTSYNVKDQIFGGIFGSGIDSNIQDAYKFLMWNYEEGDEIFLFGFSRGAYTVRSLAGLIRNCGIMKPDYLHLVDQAYHLYRDRTPLTHPESDLMKSFKKCYSIEKDPIIQFMGVWDTVGALGIPLSSFNWFNKKYHFHDVKLSRSIKYAYQALSIDEKRKAFAPCLWEVNAENDGQVCEQVWFAGVHSDVGGGFATTGLSDISLTWMIEKAKAVGLGFQDGFASTIKKNICEKVNNASPAWFLFTQKKAREINRGYIITPDPDTGKLQKREAKTNESVHYSCFERCYKVKKYLPHNFVKAVAKNIPYEPVKDNWESEWLEFLSYFEDVQNLKKSSILAIKNFYFKSKQFFRPNKG